MPLDLAAFSSKPERGYIIQRFIDLALKEAKGQWEAEHETEMLQQHAYQEHQQRRGIHDEEADVVTKELERRLHRKHQKLSRAMKDLKQTQMQLNALQRKLNEAAKEVTAATSTSAPPPRATYGSRETKKDEPEVSSILGPYYHGEGADAMGEDRDDDDVYDRVENDPTAIQAPQQLEQQQHQKDQSISHKMKKAPPSSYYPTSPSSPRSGRICRPPSRLRRHG